MFFIRFLLFFTCFSHFFISRFGTMSWHSRWREKIMMHRAGGASKLLLRYPSLLNLRLHMVKETICWLFGYRRCETWIVQTGLWIMHNREVAIATLLTAAAARRAVLSSATPVGATMKAIGIEPGLQFQSVGLTSVL